MTREQSDSGSTSRSTPLAAAIESRIDTVGPSLVAALAAVGAVIAPATPTGTMIWDDVLAGVLAAVVVFAASRSQRWPVIALGSLAAGLGGLSIWGLVGAVALALGIGSVFLPRRSRVIGAIAAALAVQTLLRLPAFGFFGLPSLIAGAAFTVVLIAGYRNMTSKVRWRFRAGFLAVATAAIAISVIGAIAMIDARSEVEAGVDAAERALDAGRLGAADDASLELSRAETLLQSANRRVSGPLPRLLRLLPVASQHQRTIEEATSVGEAIASQAATIITDLDAIDASLQAGSVDLTVLESMAPRVRATSDKLLEAKVRLGQSESPWLLPQITDRLDALDDDLDDLLPEVQLAAEATEHVPDLLGVAEPQHYLVFFGTPAEAREFGGFVGSWALVSFANGDAELVDSGRKLDLYPVAQASSIDPATTMPWFMEMARPTQYPENLTSSPDFEFVADMTNQVLGDISDRPLAGVIYLDAWALTEMLSLTGPVEVPFQDNPLTRGNAERFFFHDQYDFISDRNDLFDSLSDVAESVLDQLTSAALPGPDELGRVLGPAARGGHLQMITFDDDHNDFLRSVKLLRDFGPTGNADFVALVHSNGLSNKMDLYLQRTLDYSATVNDRGELTATAVATLRSVVPADATEYALGRDADSGTNRVVLSLYTPHELTELRVNGVVTEARRATEFGLQRYLVPVDVAPTGELYEITFELTGYAIEPYTLEVWRQPLVNNDQVSLHYDGLSGTLDWQGALVENRFAGPVGTP